MREDAATASKLCLKGEAFDIPQLVEAFEVPQLV